MTILYLVNQADAQSVPLELGLALSAREPAIQVMSYYGRGSAPAVPCKSFEATRLADPRAVTRLARWLRRERPRIIHLHHAGSTALAVALAKTLSPETALVKTEHNDHRRAPRHQTALTLALAPTLTRLICNSDTTLTSLAPATRQRLGSRAVRIYNGVDLDRLGRHAPGAESTWTLGTVGRLVAQKNHDTLLRAFAAFKRAAPSPTRLEILGDGPLRAPLEQQAKALGIDKDVTFLGATSRAMVYNRLTAWHGFIMPSHFEGFCNALIEAIATGLPVAISDIDTLREVAGPGFPRFDPTSASEMAHAIRTLRETPVSAPEIAAQYALQRACDTHLELYATIAQERMQSLRLHKRRTIRP